MGNPRRNLLPLVLLRARLFNWGSQNRRVKFNHLKQVRDECIEVHLHAESGRAWGGGVCRILAAKKRLNTMIYMGLRVDYACRPKSR